MRSRVSDRSSRVLSITARSNIVFRFHRSGHYVARSNRVRYAELRRRFLHVHGDVFRPVCFLAGGARELDYVRSVIVVTLQRKSVTSRYSGQFISSARRRMRAR